MIVEPIKRKRVTRVGSGAWSVYLPKKWIDSWTQQQQEGREVDLHLISGSLLIVPVVQDRTYVATAPAGVPLLRITLLSAYVRGYEKVELRPTDRFPNDAIAAARDLLRHLDERIVATVGPDLIGFTMPPGGSNPPTDLLQVMGARLTQTLDLAAECVEHASNDPERVVHAARLLQSIQEEDVSRILHQTLRRVATLDLPLESVSDFQLLDMAAFLLDGVGSQALAIAQTVLRDLGLSLQDLAYPREDVLRRLPKRDPQPPVARDILQGHRTAVREARDLLGRLLPALRDSDLAALGAVVADSAKARDDLQARVFEAVVRHWGEESSPEDATRGFAAYQLTNPLSNLASAIGACAGQALLFLAAKKPAVQPT
ncbi:MAG: hypothetical protein AABY18_06825 [Candidatus Thermoplasmatota archaeon]